MANDVAIAHKRIRLRIPKDYHSQPVISRLVSDYGLTVNITAAVRSANAVGDGWFDLDLQGTIGQIDRALGYLHELGLQIWDNNSDRRYLVNLHLGTTKSMFSLS
jgi:NIL domain